jgi:hypothetical protein
MDVCENNVSRSPGRVRKSLKVNRFADVSGHHKYFKGERDFISDIVKLGNL